MSIPQPVRHAANATWSFVAPRPAPGAVRPLVYPAAVSAVTLLVCCLIFSPKLGLIGMLGSLAPYWETGRPFWARVRNSLLVAAGLCGAMGLGILAAPYPWAIVPVSILAVLLLGMIYQTFMLTAGPTPCMLFYAAVIGTYFGAQSHAGWNLVGVTAFSALLASFLLLLPLIKDFRAPERRALASAEQAVAAYRAQGHAELAEQRGLRNAAYAAVAHAGLTLKSSWPANRGPAFEGLARRLETVGGELVTATDWPIPAGQTVGRAILGRPRSGFLIRRAMHPHSMEWFVTWRMALAALISGAVSVALGIGHPYWAILTATIVINQWADKQTSVRRAAHRTVGTLIGVGITLLIEACEPSEWVCVVLVIATMVGMYLVLPMNYALALMFVTPMALLCVSVSSAGSGQMTANSDRIWDTIIAAVTSVLVMWISGWGFPKQLVAAQSARTASAVRSLGRNSGTRAPLELLYELTHHQNVLERATKYVPELARSAQDEHRVADEGYAQLAKVWPAARV